MHQININDIFVLLKSTYEPQEIDLEAATNQYDSERVV